ncbi:MAG: hypothetical protein FWH52_01395 [Synergistaceae bacterium]|nr:hypothetical protein [Synergistaceae bacterium]
MKAIIKHSFLAGARVRGPVFIVVCLMNIVNGVFMSLDLLTVDVHSMTVKLGVAAIFVILVVNITDDIAVVKRMVIAPNAYLYALIPISRAKMLFAGIVYILIINTITMTAVVVQVIWLYNRMFSIQWFFEILANITALYLSLYLMLVLIILFNLAFWRSIYNRRGYPARAQAIISTCTGIVLHLTLSYFVMSQFGVMDDLAGNIIDATLGSPANTIYVILTLLQCAVLFILISMLLEKKVDI